MIALLDNIALDVRGQETSHYEIHGINLGMNDRLLMDAGYCSGISVAIEGVQIDSEGTKRLKKIAGATIANTEGVPVVLLDYGTPNYSYTVSVFFTNLDYEGGVNFTLYVESQES